LTRLARLESLPLLAIVSSLTALWLGVWVEWLLGAWFAGFALPRLWPAGLALAGLASAVLTNIALDRRHVARPAARAALAGAGGVAVFLLVGWALGARVSAEALRTGTRFAGVVGPGATAFLAGLYAWWRGERLGRSPLGNQAVRSAFYTGVTALAPLLVLNGLFAAVSSALVLGTLVLFFALGLTGLALSSLHHLRRQQPSGPAALSMSRQWLLTSSAIIVSVLGAGLLAARVAAPQALDRLTASLASLAGGLAYGLGLLLGPLAALLDRLLAPALPGLARFLEQFITSLGMTFARLQSLFAALAQLLSFGFPRFLSARWLQDLLASPTLQIYARWVGVLALLALAAGIFWLAARRLWGLQSTDVDEQRESVLSGRLLLAQLMNLLNRRPRRRPAASPAYLSLSGRPDDARLIIRRAYQAMLEWARSLRLPRAAGQTPRAYAQMLTGAVPEGHDAIDLLTQAYVLARYAADAPSLEQARRAEGAMARLKALHS
jgi:hypothetical protein